MTRSALAVLFLAAPAVADEPVRFRELPLPEPGHVDGVAFSPDGKLVAAGAGTVIAVWDAATGKEVTRMRLPEAQAYQRLVFTPDGKKLVSDCREDPAVRVWDATTGKQLAEWAHPRPAGARRGFSSPFVAFAPGARRVAVHGKNRDYFRTIEMLDPLTGKALGAIKTDDCRGASFSADGTRFATDAGDGALKVWDPATGQLVKALDPGSRNRVGAFTFATFSPDGTFVAAGGHTDEGVSVWGVADGTRYCRLLAAPANNFFHAAAMSADNRFLAGAAADGVARLFDLAADAPVPGWGPPTARGCHRVSSPDGKVLALVAPASGPEGRQMSVYLTTFPEARDAAPPAELTGRDLDDRWAALSSENEFRRRKATTDLLAHPDQSAAYAGERLKPVPDVARKRVEDLVKNLDDDDATFRDRVTTELEGVAHAFAPHLAAALAAAPAGEVRNRLTLVTKTAATRPPPAGLVADLRGIEFLAELGTPAAAKVLDGLAAGAAGARVTAEAAAARKRVADKPR